MGQKASYRPDFKVAETRGKAAQGPNSLLSYNNRIVAAKTTAETFEPMFRLCLACATQRKLIAKVRGDSTDFLNYATMGYVIRWQKQFEEHDNRRPVDFIQNWIPYILGTIRFALIAYNKEVWDYDFLPLPRVLEDEEDEVGTRRDMPDITSMDEFSRISLSFLADKETLRSMLFSLSTELQPYLVDILYYMRTKGGLLSRHSSNFARIGRNLMRDALEAAMLDFMD